MPVTPGEGQVIGNTAAGGYIVGHAGGVVATDEAGNYGHGYGYGYQGYGQSYGAPGYAAPGYGPGTLYQGYGYQAPSGVAQGVTQAQQPAIGYSAQVQSSQAQQQEQQQTQQAQAQSAPVAVGGQCHFVDATVVKSIHAICVSADGHQFPASHMTADTWITSGYEGEIARCLPGSTLRVLVGSVLQSDQGMAASFQDATALMCGPGEAVRHYKDGMLKCAPAEKVVDCTERTNLRKYGTGDMFFTYMTRVCLEQHENLVGGQSKESASEAATRAQSFARTQATQQSSSYSSSSSSNASTSSGMTLSGMTLTGGVGGLGFY